MGKTSKKNQPKTKQPTLFHFQGFENLSGTRNLTSSQNKFAKDFCCEFCDQKFAHDGARKMHQSWCKERPKPVETITSEDLVCETNSDAVVAPILEEILDKVFEQAGSTVSGGWNLAKIFVKKPSKKRLHDSNGAR